MKANAPEKLYISDSELNDAKHCVIWFKSQQNEKDIEYTRTNAFIEKATEWLFNQANIYTDIEIDSNNGGVYTKFHADEMVKDFIKAMKL